MPTYEYRCKHCNAEHQFFQRMTENPKRKCPKCGKLKLERLISSGGGVIFKGSGFYETDYKRKSDPESSQKKENKSSDGETKKSDTATKSESNKKE